MMLRPAPVSSTCSTASGTEIAAQHYGSVEFRRLIRDQPGDRQLRRGQSQRDGVEPGEQIQRRRDHPAEPWSGNRWGLCSGDQIAALARLHFQHGELDPVQHVQTVVDQQRLPVPAPRPAGSTLRRQLQ